MSTQRFSVADALSLLRIPLAVVFAAVDDTTVRVIVLVVAAISDFSDGWIARRLGSSRMGTVLDPIADKLFTATAFVVVLLSSALAWYEVVLVLIRDLVATIAVLASVVVGRATTVPARAGGKAVTLLQLITLLAFLLDSPLLRPLAWATGAVALYALWDYNRLFFRKPETQ
jgi:phosphatidylglycerophosphate synthase